MIEYGMSYCERKGLSTSDLTEAQQTLYYIAEYMRGEQKISKDGYEHFQKALKALDQMDVLDKIRAEIVDLGQCTMNDNRASGIWACRDIIDKYKAESED